MLNPSCLGALEKEYHSFTSWWFMGLNGLKNTAPKAIRLSFPGMFQGRWELVWLWSLVEAESKELLFKPNQGDKMAQEKGKGKSPCEDLKLGWSTESWPGMEGGNCFWYFRNVKCENGGAQKNLTVGKMKAGGNTWPLVARYLVQSLNSSRSTENRSRPRCPSNTKKWLRSSQA